MRAILNNLLHATGLRRAPVPDYLRGIRGIVHIGANDGGERRLYERLGLDVLWVEAMPDTFKSLEKNLAGFPRQRALNYLLVDQDGVKTTFNVASNSGASSSVFKFADHAKIWPDVHFVDELELTGYRFATMVECENVDLAKYDFLLVDTQGAEMLVLKGAQECLGGVQRILAEAADFPSYEGGATLEQIEGFLTGKGFRLAKKYEFARMDGVGRYCDALFERVD
jgi:FkbM family methyltransferase